MARQLAWLVARTPTIFSVLDYGWGLASYICKMATSNIAALSTVTLVLSYITLTLLGLSARWKRYVAATISSSWLGCLTNAWLGYVYEKFRETSVPQTVIQKVSVPMRDAPSEANA